MMYLIMQCIILHPQNEKIKLNIPQRKSMPWLFRKNIKEMYPCWPPKEAPMYLPY